MAFGVAMGQDVNLEAPAGGAPLHISLVDLVKRGGAVHAGRRGGRSLMIDGKEVELTPSLGYMLGGLGLVTAAGAGYLVYKDVSINLTCVSLQNVN